VRELARLGLWNGRRHQGAALCSSLPLLARAKLGMSLQDRMNEANSMVASGEFASALSIYDELLLEVASDAHPSLHYNRGVCFSQLGDEAGAEAAFRLCVEGDSSKAGAWHNLGVAHLNRNEYDEAAECMDKAVEGAESIGDGAQATLSRLARASVAKARGDYDDAIAQFSAVITSEQERSEIPPPNAWCQRAELYCLKEDWAAAESDYASCERLHGELSAATDGNNRAIALFHLGRAHQEAGEVAEAEDCYRRSIALRGTTHTMHNLSVLLMTQSREAEAEPIFREILEKDPEHTLALTAYSTWLAQVNRFDEAIPMLRRAAAVVEASGDVHAITTINLALGIALFKQKQPKDALKYFNAVLHHEPDNSRAKNGVMVCEQALARAAVSAAAADDSLIEEDEEEEEAVEDEEEEGPAAEVEESVAHAPPASEPAPVVAVAPAPKPAPVAPKPAPVAPKPASGASASASGSAEDSLGADEDGYGGIVFDLEELTHRPSPADVDPTIREAYLSRAQFQTAFGMDKPSFYALPKWKRVQLRKKTGLF
jgi:tetratricopeptide (TPR) repeat protein